MTTTGETMRRWYTAPYILTLIVLNALVGVIRVSEGPQRTTSIAYKTGTSGTLNAGGLTGYVAVRIA